MATRRWLAQSNSLNPSPPSPPPDAPQAANRPELVGCPPFFHFHLFLAVPDLASFQSVIDSSQKQLGVVVIGAIWAGIGYAAKLAWEGIKGWLAARKAVKQANPLYLAEKQIALSLAAYQACQWAGASHVSIYQFHNGAHFSNGDSIQKASMVGEAVDNNAMARWLSQSQNLALANFPHLLTGLAKGHVWLYRDECEDYQLNQYMRERGYTSRVVCLLTGAKGTWLGLLAISFSEGHFTDEALPALGDCTGLQMLEEHRRACASILANP